MKTLLGFFQLGVGMKKNWFTPLIVILLLVVFPAISWIYLKKGFNYQKSNFEKLKLYGALPVDSLASRDGCFTTLAPGEVTLLVVGNPENQSQILELAAKLSEQFAATQKFKFLVWSPVSPYSGNKNVEACLPDSASITLLQSNYGASTAFANGKELMIIDARLQVRKYYRLGIDEDEKELVTHIALLLPKEKER